MVEIILRTPPMALKTAMLPILFLQICSSFAFSPPVKHASHIQQQKQNTQLSMAGGEGGETEWVKALEDAAGGTTPGKFEEEMKMKGLLGPNKGDGNPKLSANSRLIQWLENEGQVYLSESSTWGEAPHPLAISTETVDEITNESSGRGLLARRKISDGDELLKI